MTGNIFERILKTGQTRKDGSIDIEKSRKWFRQQAEQVSSVNTIRLIRESRSNQNPRQLVARHIGRMFLFNYDPKLKNELPYYDKFPIVFPFTLERNGFKAVNLHYLPPILRARLMDAFYTIANNDRYDHTTKLKITYQLMHSVSKQSLFKPCIKHYLYNQVRSQLTLIDSEQWEIALFLPLQSFKKAPESKVWKDSRKIIANANR